MFAKLREFHMLHKEKKKKKKRASTFMFFVGSNPSSWLSNSSIVLCTSESPPPEPDSIRDDPIESISSMNMIDGACSLQQIVTY